MRSMKIAMVFALLALPCTNAISQGGPAVPVSPASKTHEQTQSGTPRKDMGVNYMNLRDRLLIVPVDQSLQNVLELNKQQRDQLNRLVIQYSSAMTGEATKPVVSRLKEKWISDITTVLSDNQISILDKYTKQWRVTSQWQRISNGHGASYWETAPPVVDSQKAFHLPMYYPDYGKEDERIFILEDAPQQSGLSYHIFTFLYGPQEDRGPGNPMGGPVPLDFSHKPKRPPVPVPKIHEIVCTCTSNCHCADGKPCSYMNVCPIAKK